jgi:hypothetical protein
MTRSQLVRTVIHYAISISVLLTMLLASGAPSDFPN